MKKRKQISTKTRFDIFKRDQFTCQYCSATPPQAILHIDHINPVANGGKNDDDNLVTACSDCNSGKGARLLTSVPQSLKEKAADVAEREAQLKGYQYILQCKRSRLDDEQWQVAEIFKPRCSSEGLSRSYLRSIRMFIEKLGLHEVIEAMEIAVDRKAISHKSTQFKYFCGTCWNKINRGENG